MKTPEFHPAVARKSWHFDHLNGGPEPPHHPRTRSSARNGNGSPKASEVEGRLAAQLGAVRGRRIIDIGEFDG